MYVCNNNICFQMLHIYLFFPSQAASERKQQQHMEAAAAANEDFSDGNESPRVAGSRRNTSARNSSSSATSAGNSSNNMKALPTHNKAAVAPLVSRHAPASVAPPLSSSNANFNRQQQRKRFLDDDDELSDDDAKDKMEEFSDTASSCDSRVRTSGRNAAVLDELEDKDGAIAELRRRAPEVTVTLVKQEEQVCLPWLIKEKMSIIKIAYYHVKMLAW